MKLPEKFKERMLTYDGVDAERLFYSLENGEPQRAFRVNNIKISTEDYLKINPIDATPIPFAEEGFYTDAERVGGLPHHHAGMIYMQDPSAMITVKALDIKEGWRVLDSCASPGGKTTQLSAAVGDSGIVVCNEYVTKRCRILEENITRLGCRNTVILNLDTKYIAEFYPEKFDLVLCDAPCSGEGMFRKNELAVSEWSPENVEMCAERQMEILENCARCVEKDGYLLYSTCTFSLEENERNVESFLNSHPEFCLCDVSEAVKKHTADGIVFDGCTHDMTLTRRFYPYVSDGEGQFIALMRKTESVISEKTVRRADKKARDGKGKPQAATMEAISVVNKFIADNLCGVDHLKPFIYNDKVYLCPDIEIMPFGVFSAGVLMGEVRKGRLVPSHHLFSALGKYFKNKIELSPDDPRVTDYVNGYEITIPEAPNGFAVITICGAPLGGVKASGGACKNHYLK